jgi:hypothetical protein
MRWHKWVVLIAESTRQHYVLFALPNLHAPNRVSAMATRIDKVMQRTSPQ